VRAAPAEDRYAALHAGFRWSVPARFNIAEVCCARWARDTPDAVAIRWEHENGDRADYTYAELQQARTGSRTRCAGSASSPAIASRS
jgi:acetyl-CoA synthetase